MLSAGEKASAKPGSEVLDPCLNAGYKREAATKRKEVGPSVV